MPTSSRISREKSTDGTDVGDPVPTIRFQIAAQSAVSSTARRTELGSCDLALRYRWSTASYGSRWMSLAWFWVATSLIGAALPSSSGLCDGCVAWWQPNMIKFAIVRTAIPTRVLRMILPPSDVARHEPEETYLDEHR